MVEIKGSYAKFDRPWCASEFFLIVNKVIFKICVGGWCFFKSNWVLPLDILNARDSLLLFWNSVKLLFQILAYERFPLSVR